MTSSPPDEGALEPADQQALSQVRGEPRWPMATAVLVSVALQLSLPDRHVLSPTVLFPTVEVLLLVVLTMAVGLYISNFRPPRAHVLEVGSANYTAADVEAVATLMTFVDSGAVDFDTAVNLTRGVGQTMARLADWEVSALVSRVEEMEAGEEATGSRIGSALRLIDEVNPPFERLLVYAWRRHLAAAVARIGDHEWPVRLTPTVRAAIVEIAALHHIRVDPDAPGFDVDELLGKLGPAAALIEPTVRNSANPTMLEAGYKINVIPGHAIAYVDGRMLPGGEAEFHDTMDRLTGPDVQWEFHHREAALQAPVDSPTYAKLRAAVERFDPAGHYNRPELLHFELRV